MIETKYRILVVDDHPALVTLIKHKLIHRGFEVLTAQNGEDAFELVEKESPDLVIQMLRCRLRMAINYVQA